MKGQMTYDEKAKSWTFTPAIEITALIAGTGKPKIQWRDGYYRAWDGELTNSSESLTDMILWIQG